VRRVFSGDDGRSDEGDDAPLGWSDELRDARRTLLRAALGKLGDASPEEQRRVAEILVRAAREIRGK
jgi:hypothetical protein